MPYLILVVDDEPDIRDVLGEVFVEEGYRVHRAADGQEALTLAAQEPPDVVVSDIRMPRMDGLDLDRIRAAVESSLAGG